MISVNWSQTWPSATNFQSFLNNILLIFFASTDLKIDNHEKRLQWSDFTNFLWIFNKLYTVESTVYSVDCTKTMLLIKVFKMIVELSEPAFLCKIIWSIIYCIMENLMIRFWSLGFLMCKKYNLALPKSKFLEIDQRFQVEAEVIFSDYLKSSIWCISNSIKSYELY